MRLAERRVASGRFQEEEEDGDDEAIQIENTFYEADDNKVFASCSQKKVAVTHRFPQQCAEALLGPGAASVELAARGDAARDRAGAVLQSRRARGQARLGGCRRWVVNIKE